MNVELCAAWRATFASICTLIFASIFAIEGTFVWSAPSAAAQEWSAPYCGEQPHISSIFDHNVPLYQADGTLVLFNGADIANCPDDSDPAEGLGYDGHSGWDYTRAGRVQGCMVDWREGFGQDLVYAVDDGIVRKSRWFHPSEHDNTSEAGYGLYLDIEHAGERGSLYGHLAAVFVDEGDTVSRGQVVGALGTTGRSSGPHLHFQAAKGPDAAPAYHSFDPYGWDRSFVGGTPPNPPPFPDPHRGAGWSERLLEPGQSGPACPSYCGEEIVDDDSSDVVFGCLSGAACAGWQRDERGYGSGHHFVAPNGATADHFATYTCSNCAPGAYRVKAFIPFGSGIANTHIARYELGAEVSILDQHTEGGRWQTIGIFDYMSTPWVRLSDRSDRHNYTAPRHQKIAADAIKFERICEGLPANTPQIGPPTKDDQRLNSRLGISSVLPNTFQAAAR